MKNIRYLCVALLLGAALPHTKASAGDGEGYELGISANVGFLSQYIYRGIKQSDSAAMGGLDVEYGPFYAGTWLADVSDGGDGLDGSIEYDLYAGLSYALGDAVTVGVGYTSYQYTDLFDSAYNETNLALGFASEDFPLTLDIEYSFGEHTNGGPGPVNRRQSDADYTFAAATLGYKGLFLTYGGFSEDWEGHYVEVGYGTTVMEVLDVGLGFVNPSRDLGADGGNLDDGGNTRLYFSVSTTFDL